MKIECIMGMSLDGRIDWIKNPQEFQELYYGIVMQSQYDGTICGSATMLDAPYDEQNTVKYSDQQLVVVDSGGKIANWPVIKRQAWWNDTPVVLCSEATKSEYLRLLEKDGVKYIVTGKDKVDLKAAVALLEKDFGIHTMRIDSGGRLLGAMLRAELVQNITAVILPQMTGGMTPRGIFVADDLKSLDGVVSLRLIESRTVKDQYVVLSYEVLQAG